MEEIEPICKLLKKALKTLDASFKVLQEAEQADNEGFILASQDSIIQRFEYCYDSFWKFLKRYLEKHLKLTDIASPKKVFREAVKHTLCTPEEGEILIAMADDRNVTTHNYDITQVRKILPAVPSYYNCMTNILNHIENKLDLSK